MLAKRLIPCLDVKDGRVVKGINFTNLIDAGDPVEQAQFYDAEGADELVFLDITASHDKRQIVIDMIREVASRVFIPFTVGGGIRTADDVRDILRAGADKVSVNSAAVNNPDLIREGARAFGSQCMVLAIDAKRKNPRGDQSPRSEPTPPKGDLHAFNGQSPSGDLSYEPGNLFPGWEVYINGGRIATGLDALAWAKQGEQLGAGEILLTSMDRDGTRQGYDLELLRAVADSVKIPVIASGGAGSMQHFRDAFILGGADAVLAASLFHYRELSIGETKAYLEQNGIYIRNVLREYPEARQPKKP